MIAHSDTFPDRPLQRNWLAFFSRKDDDYANFVERHQAKTRIATFYYLAMHLVPGIAAYGLVNIPDVYNFMRHRFELNGDFWQAYVLIGCTFVWHLFWPFLTLRIHDRLSFSESIAFLGLKKFDARGVFLVAPVVCLMFVLVALPYVSSTYPAMKTWLQAIPWLSTPAYSLFQDGRVFSLPPALLILLAIGNYVGEEVYYRGYLLKKIGSLGGYAWVVNSLLFGLYHLWQAPETWPLTPIALFFGWLMQMRKNLWPLIVFHIFVNAALGPIIGYAYS